MLFFRSEEHLDRWNANRGDDRGAILDLQLAWRLADAWYRDRMDPDWSRPSADRIEALFTRLGLTGNFWRLRT